MITLQPKEVVAYDSEHDEGVFQLEMNDEHTATLKVPAAINPSNWPEISAKIAEALAMMFPGEAAQESDILAECRNLIGKPVVIRWKNPEDDWPNFFVTSVIGSKVLLKGRDLDDGFKHGGDSFLVNPSEIASITEG